MRPTAPLLAVACLLPLPALADRVHLRSGRVLEGTVDEQADGSLKVRTDSGAEARIPAEQVLRVERGPTAAQEADARLAALTADDLAGHKALAGWCDERGLKRRARAIREGIVARWPDDVETRRALDQVLHDGEWLTREEYMRRLGLVRSPDDRSWLTPEEAARRAEDQRASERERQVERLLRRASYADVEPLAAALQAYDDASALPALERAARAANLGTRRLAVQELGRRRAQQAELTLAKVAVEDAKRVVREDALAALQRLEPRDAPAYFLRAVAAVESPFQRVHAVQALGVFPAPGAVPVLVRALREATSNFGRASISIVTQRAYIQDFELSSGGTGNVVAEVADPVIGTFSEGVTLEMKVIHWERTTIVEVLRRLTGQGFGPEPDRWQRWWEEQR